MQRLDHSPKKSKRSKSQKSQKLQTLPTNPPEHKKRNKLRKTQVRFKQALKSQSYNNLKERANPDKALKSLKKEKYRMDTKTQMAKKDMERNGTFQRSYSDDTIGSILRKKEEMSLSFKCRDGVLFDLVSDQVVGASLEGIVYLSVLKEMDSEECLRMVLLSHKMFFESEALVEALMKLLERRDLGVLLELTVKTKVVSVLLYWMQYFHFHFDEELVRCVEEVYYMLERQNDHCAIACAGALLDAIDIMRVQIDQSESDSSSHDMLKIRRSSRGQILEWDIFIIAKELTLLQTESFLLVNLCKVFDKGWSKNEPYLVESSAISNWVIVECLSTADRTLEEQCEVISFFISLCSHLRELRNFNSCFFVYSGLCLFEVEKLPGWRNISDKANRKWKRTTRLCNPINSFKFISAMQDATDITEHYILPLLPLITQTLIRYKETIDNLIYDKYFNLTKMGLFYDKLKDLENLQKKAQPTIQSDKDCRRFLKTQLEFVKNENYLKSLGINLT